MGFVIAFTLSMLFVFASIWALGRSNEAANRAWQAAADQLGGEFDPRQGRWGARTRELVVPSGDARIVVDLHTFTRGKNASEIHTRARVDVANADDLVLTVRPRRLLTGIEKALGGQDAKTGDAKFDQEFVVETNDQALARAWLTTEVRDALRAAGGYELSIRNGFLSLQKHVLEGDTDRLVALVKACGALQRRGENLRAGWQQLASDHGVSLDADRWRIVIDEGRVPLRIETEPEGEETVTVVEGRSVGGKMDAYELSADDVRAKRVGALRVASDGERVRVELPGIVTDSDQLAEACDLATMLADQQSSAYR